MDLRRLLSIVIALLDMFLRAGQRWASTALADSGRIRNIGIPALLSLVLLPFLPQPLQMVTGAIFGALLAYYLARIRSKALVASLLALSLLLPMAALASGNYTPGITNGLVGSWQAGDFVTVSTTGNTHSNTTLDNIPSTANMFVGEGITGTGIPANTTIAAIPNSTTVTLSASATATATGVSISALGGIPNKANPGNGDAYVVSASGWTTSGWSISSTTQIRPGYTSPADSKVWAAQSYSLPSVRVLDYISAAATGNTTNGSTSVTSATNTGNLYVGQTVSGTGIQGGTTVTALTSNTITLSLAATATNSSVSITGTAIHQGLRFPQGLTGANDWTFTVAMNDNSSSVAGKTSVVSDSSSLNTFALQKQSGYTLDTSSNTVSVSTSTSDVPSGYLKLYVVRFNHTTKTLSINFDTRLNTQAAIALASNLNLAGLQIGGVTAGSSNRRTDTSFVVLNAYSRYLSDVECFQEMRKMASDLCPGLTVYFWFGNSHFVGYQSSNTQTKSMRALIEDYILTTLGKPAVFVEDCTTGRQTTAMLGRASFSTVYQGLAGHCVALTTEDTNVKYYTGLTPYSYNDATSTIWVEARCRQLMEECYRAGFDVVLPFTTLARFVGDSSGYRPAVISDRASTLSFFAGFDLRRNFGYLSVPFGELTNTSDNTNTTYFNADAIHLNDTGYQYASDNLRNYVVQAGYPASACALGSASSITNTTASVTWTAHGTSPTGGTVTDQLYVADAGTGNWQAVSGATSSPGSITGLLAGRRYDLLVKSTDSNATGLKIWSNVTSFQTTGSPADNSTPTVTDASLSTDGRTVTITLSKPCSGESGFHFFINGGSEATLTQAPGRTDSTHIVYRMPYTVYTGLTITYTYTVDTLANVVDTTTNSNAVAAISSTSVTNNSDVAGVAYNFYGLLSSLAYPNTQTVQYSLTSTSSDPLHLPSQTTSTWIADGATLSSFVADGVTVNPLVFLQSNSAKVARIILRPVSTVDGTTTGNAPTILLQSPRTMQRQNGRVNRRKW